MSDTETVLDSILSRVEELKEENMRLTTAFQVATVDLVQADRRVKELEAEIARLAVRIEAYEKEDKHEAMSCYLSHKRLSELELENKELKAESATLRAHRAMSFKK
jgi:ribosomal protein L29